MSRPLIGLPGRRKLGRQVAGIPESLHDRDLDLYFADYARGVLEAGGLPVHLPLDVDPIEAASRLDGVVLTGGADIDPGRYGAVAKTEEFPPEPIRDDFELGLLHGAISSEIPVLGICRGLQLMNVAAGGTLHQDVPPHARFDDPPTLEAHEVAFVPGTRLHDLYGASRLVNSLHHQTIDRLGAGLVVSASAHDGVVEGIESADGLLLAVQWHPEMMSSRADDPVFGWIVEAAGRR